VTADGDIGEAGARLRVDDRERPGAVADVQTLLGGVVAEIVGFLGEGDPAAHQKRRRVQDVERPALPVRHEQRIDGRDEGDALRRVEAAEGPRTRAGAQIHDLDGVVSPRGHEQPLPRDVHREVIDASRNARKRDRLDEGHGRNVVGARAYRRQHGENARDGERRDPRRSRRPVCGPRAHTHTSTGLPPAGTRGRLCSEEERP
jgi:hypothetical protein